MKLLRDIGFFIISAIAGYFLWKWGTLAGLLEITAATPYLNSFVAGAMFTSAITVGPATAAIALLASSGVSPIEITLIGALGAMTVEVGAFILLRDTIALELRRAGRRSKRSLLGYLIFRGRWRFVSIIIGALIIASPLPDEAGILLLSLERPSWKSVLVLTFLLNALGILAVTTATQQLL